MNEMGEYLGWDYIQKDCQNTGKEFCRDAWPDDFQPELISI